MLSKTFISTYALLVAASAVVCAMLLWQYSHDFPKNHLALPLLLAAAAGALLGGLYLAKAPAPARDERSRAEDAEGACGDAVFGVTPDGYIISWNAAAERMSGYSAKEAIGRHMSVILNPDASPEQARRLAQACRGEKVEPGFTCIGKDGCKMELCSCPDPFFCDDEHGLL